MIGQTDVTASHRLSQLNVFQRVLSGTELTGVIDWENVRLGDTRYDVAQSLSILCADPSIPALPKRFGRSCARFDRATLKATSTQRGQRLSPRWYPSLLGQSISYCTTWDNVLTDKQR